MVEGGKNQKSKTADRFLANHSFMFSKNYVDIIKSGGDVSYYNYFIEDASYNILGHVKNVMTIITGELADENSTIINQRIIDKDGRYLFTISKKYNYFGSYIKVTNAECSKLIGMVKIDNSVDKNTKMTLHLQNDDDYFCRVVKDPLKQDRLLLLNKMDIVLAKIQVIDFGASVAIGYYNYANSIPEVPALTTEQKATVISAILYDFIYVLAS